MVMNCMFYGDITGGSSKSPVYGGTNISNVHGGLNTFNYYSYEQLPTEHITDGKYNSALSIDDKYLNRFEFYRLLLNSNKELAAYYASSSTKEVKATEMMKWVLETADRSITEPKPYPILKAQGEYPSIINYDTRDLANYSEENRNKGLKTGTLSVTISGVGSNAPGGASIIKGSLELPRTDKDFDRFNYNYDKVQLPYYNDVGTKNYTGDKVVTGWKITAITSVAGDPYTSANYNYTKSYSSEASYFDYPNYNFADRKSSNKDLYSVSGRVFSQGAYFDVPYGVTSITIEPYWGDAVYVADKYYDVVYNTGYTRQDVTQLGTQVDGSTVFNGQSVKPIYYKDNNDKKYIGDYLSFSGSTVYDNAIVLVGNVHQNAIPSSGDKPFTIMSVDEDNDHEPDYSMIYHHDGRTKISPIRFDFINIPGTCQAQKPNGVSKILNFTIFRTRGWFETTNTCLVYSNQVEYENQQDVTKLDHSPLILLGGDFEQFVSTQKVAPSGKTIYIHVGSNVIIENFGLGTHGDGSNATPHVPLSVTGGEFKGFYLTGTYNPNAGVKTDNAECYISGGHFVEAAGACQEQINGNVQWQIYDADIDAFFGGGINDAKPIKGTITTDIYNSHVGTFCGGPKFGDMAATKNVTTTATGCTFDTYFGAGYGGISYNRIRTRDKSGTDVDFSSWKGDYTGKRGRYYTDNKGIATDFDYEFFVWSTGVVGARFYVKYSSLSMAKTNDVSSTLTNCIINKNFYGGGNLGKVDGKATSVLNSCTVEGNVFGGGYSASTPKVPIRTSDVFASTPGINADAGVFDMGEKSATEDYTLVQGTLTNNSLAINKDTKTITTNVDMTVLGQVTTTDLTISGNTIVRGQIFDEEGEVSETTGGVFGGGDMSAVNGNTDVKIQGTEATEGVLNVFGGGNKAIVVGATTVEIDEIGGTSFIQNNVYGGGNEADVQKTTTVNMKAGTVKGNIFGGGNLGDVGTLTPIAGKPIGNYTWAEGTGLSTVDISGGTVGPAGDADATEEYPGDVYGGGKGSDYNFWCEKGMVNNTIVRIRGAVVKGDVYGGGQLGRVETNTSVTIGPKDENADSIPTIKGNIFGAGKGKDTHGYSALVRGNTEVIVRNGAVVEHNVYGGGEIASVGKYNVDDSGLPYSQANSTSGNCRVNIPGTTQIKGDIFGGGKGVEPVDWETTDPKPGRMDGGSNWETFASKDAYLIYLQTLALATQTEVTINPGNTVSVIHSTEGSVYGGSENGIVQHNTLVTISGNCQIGKADDSGNVTVDSPGNVFGGGKGIAGNAGAGQVSGDATVNINNGTLLGSVYGGGVLGATRGDVTVNINGGTVNHNVYGGGAYADTNTENWSEYEEVTGLTVGETSVTGYYEQSFGGIFSTTKDTVAKENKKYYRKATETWADSEKKSSLNKTRLNLRGGTIVGDAYGGALGDATHSPKVYGDILVDLNGITSADGITGTNIGTSGRGCVVNQVFGCNNASGSPQGNVTVHVYGTQNKDASKTNIAAKFAKDDIDVYDVQAVYGGGNEAAYDPVTPNTSTTTTPNGPRTLVIIEGCDLTSIDHVYGGGNAAPVPATDVTIKGTYLINAVYGGGNGSGEGTPGADVGIINPTAYAANHANGTYGTGKAVTKLLGGYINSVYGGSNTKGDVVGGTDVSTKGKNETITITNGDYCSELKVGTVYGAGSHADVNGNVNVTLECMPEDFVDAVYGGAEMATVNGNVSLTVTSGKFGRVFGGNNDGGDIRGSITVNVYEDGCKPLIIGELYGGGNAAPYSIYGCTEGTPWTAKESGTTYYDTAEPDNRTNVEVNVYSCTSIGKVFGGGKGTTANVVGNTRVYINPMKGIVNGVTQANIGKIGQVFGGGALANVKGNTLLDIGTALASEPNGVRIESGSDYLDPEDGSLDTNITAGIYGGGSEADVDGNATLNIGTEKLPLGVNIAGNIFGGGFGETTHVTGDVKVNIGTNTGTEVSPVYVGYANITGDVYGGSAKGKVNSHLVSSVETATAGKTTQVNLFGGTISGNLYGGGLGEDNEGTENDHAADVYGPVTVNVDGGNVNKVFGCNNVLGMPKSTVVVEIGTKIGAEAPYTYSGTGTISGSVYGGGNMAACTGSPTVKLYKGTVNNNVFGGGLGSTAVTGGASVIMEGGTVGNDVYGGGSEANVSGNVSVSVSGGTVANDVFGGGSVADVTGSVSVSISGGVVTNDVYGGGALANTNTGNWDGDGSIEYEEVTGLTGTTYRVKEFFEGADVTGYYTYNSSTKLYEPATGTAVGGTTYYEQLTGAPVAGYYTESEGNYTKLTTGTANGGTTYYKKKVKGTWAEGKNDAITGTTYKTTVSLTGGLIGNAYGGGLGRQAVDAKPAVGTEGEEGYVPAQPAVSAIAANVYGDVTISVNEGVSDPTKGVIFVQRIEQVTIGGTQYPTSTSGRVFGCNNHNGTPTGNVEVHVYSTRQIDKDNKIIAGHGSSDRKYSYEIQSVYGGGNQADYIPASGKKSRVIIEGCSDTSIEKVYGGGNSAVVPETDVTIYGAYDIGYAFGGGNGDKPIKKADGNWYENEGAIVIGLASITCHGGKIGQVFGGGDAKGSCGNTNAVTAELDSSHPKHCSLHITRLYGAGNKGDVASVNIVLAACSGNAIDYVHGGSYNAHVTGDVHLTITSGILKNVYGGNDARGGIGGNIIVDIEETNGCNPIIIQNLVGGGNEAPYPGTHTVEGEEVAYTTRGNITVNVKSATRIDNIFGGSFMAEANADTEVNINMIKGNKAGETVTIPKEFSYIPNITYIEDVDDKTIRCQIKDSIGTIGNVFGGGNQGLVKGNTAVNICSSDKVSIMQRDGSGKIKVDGGGVIDAENGSNIEGKTILYNDDIDVLGAKITGNVYGGGNLADVSIYTKKEIVEGVEKDVEYGGNTRVLICGKDNGSGYVAIAQGTGGVTIAGNVYGGGKGEDDTFECEKAMVGENGNSAGIANPDGKGTSVYIGNGTIVGNVYGGGEIARVEWSTAVTIGLTPADGVASSAPEIKGNVFGAGKGVYTHGYSGLVRGNSSVTIQENAKVEHSVYGGGEKATVGRYNVVNGIPTTPLSGGNCTVIIKDNAEIGPDGMTMPTFDGNVFGAGKGVMAYEGVTGTPWSMKPAGPVYYNDDDSYLGHIETLGLASNTDVTITDNAFVKGSVYGGSENGYVQANTHVTISGGQIGCGKNTTNRHVATVWDDNYTPSDATDLECASWTYEAPYSPYDPYAKYASDGKYYYDEGHTKYAEGGAETGKDGHTYYGNVFGGGSGVKPYAPGKWHRAAGSVGGNTVVDVTGGHILTSLYGGNEQTDVGSYDKNSYGEPVVPKAETPGGKCTVNMTSGTLGVPRTLQQIHDHPVTCYLFGAGKGDQRILFNTWTNAIETEVNISGNARIYGSIFGGGEDGHVIEDAETNIGGSVTIGETTYTHTDVKIGTWGTSYVDGNVFGGGRGFSGEAVTAGTVGGNVVVNIENGTILGSIYGGGRLASVGTFFTDPNHDEYGQLKDDDNSVSYYTAEDTEVTAGTKQIGDLKSASPNKSFGHVTVNITGGIIGNKTPPVNGTYSDTKYSGNVFGGSMGRLTLLDGSTNPIWPELAQAKTATVNISQPESKTTYITGNIYGGGEFGIVRENATTSITGGVIDGCVYGGGLGSSNHTDATPIFVHWNGNSLTYVFTPIQWAGTVGGNTLVNISGATVKKNVYGGGELASVGVIDYHAEEATTGEITGIDGKKYTQPSIISHKHADIVDKGTANEKIYGFGLSWPYEFTYVSCNPTTSRIGGKTSVNISGNSTIGDGGNTENTGYVYGGGKGQVSFDATDNIAEQRYTEAFCANVRESQVTIDGASTNVRTVYGGGENGHVYTDANVIINNGNIRRSVFGGGKGDGIFTTKLWDLANKGSEKASTDEVHSWTAGKVYGNTSVTMNGGQVGWFIYGGGNMASVGKGNYAGGTDDYSTAGYGELPPRNEGANGPLWSNTNFTGSGQCTVTILGGTVGTETDGDSGTDAYINDDGIPYGSVFGGSRGQTAMDLDEVSPRYRYVPDLFLGYVNKTIINIGGTSTSDISASTPIIKGSVYGGGQDGHVRNSTHVSIFKGDIQGQGVNDPAGRSGHVFGAGSGIGKYTVIKDAVEKKYCATSSGSVTCTTEVDIYADATIAGNVYGGGALASVGPPDTGQGYYEYNTPNNDYHPHSSVSYNKVTIEGGSIGGSVFGASRGPAASFLTSAFTGGVSTEKTDPQYYNPTKFATSVWTEVNIKPNATPAKSPVIAGSVYGGGEMGRVYESTVVNLTGGSIAHDAFGGGKGTRGANAIEAIVGGNTTVELNNNNNGATATGTVKGCSVQRIFGCNDLNGTPKGHVKVHVYATQNTSKTQINSKYAQRPALGEGENKNETIVGYLKRLIDAANAANAADVAASITPKITESVVTAANNIWSVKKDLATLSSTDSTVVNTAIDNVTEELCKLYDVAAVYGGGNLAKYDPADAYSDNPTVKAAARTEVIIDGCNLTSIRQVYGGGNAAPVPGTNLTVNGTYEIDEVFGGGNGKDNYSLTEGASTVYYENPGANVGYDNFTHYGAADGDPVGTVYGTGAEDNPYRAITNKNATNKDYRQAYYMYGVGEAKTDIVGGRIHYVYGGSNEKGNISTLALSVYENSADCPVVTDKTYGAGKNAEVDARTSVSMRCVEWAGKHFGGSTNADVNSDVILNITNGHFGQVFGGNDTSGNIKGSITVNIQESSCKPIVIDELYGGGYLAGYSIYGYYNTGEKDDKGNDIYAPRTKEKFYTDKNTALSGVNLSDATAVKEALLAADLYGYPKHNPRINVISATKIGTIFGGGYQALVVGSPYVNVNMQPGIIPYIWTTKDSIPTGMVYDKPGVEQTISDGHGDYTYTITRILANRDAELAIGSIDHIYGGGNLADVNGNTNIEIGTGRWIANWDASENPIWETQNAGGDKFTYKEKTPPVTYTQDECNTYNATLIDAMPNDGTTKLTAAQANTYNAKLAGAIASGTKLTSDQATAVNTALSLTEGDAYATDGTAVITVAHAAAYNATLSGAVTNDGTGTLTVELANTYNAALIGARNTNDIKTPAVWAWYDDNENETSNLSISARNAATITGNVFGGGKGQESESGDGAFKCASAMVGADGDGLIDANGGTTVTIGNGSVGGNVYGGGEIGRVEKNTVVTIGLEGNTTNELTIRGNVFGAGKGVPTHGYAALVRGNSTVTIQGKAKVGGSVYGGGEIASVGRYNVNATTGLPESLKNEKSGNCTVIVRDDAEIGPDDMVMKKDVGDPDNKGHVFGAGRGATPYIDKEGNAWAEPWRIKPDNSKDNFNVATYGTADNAEAKYLTYIESLALATQTSVTISGNAFVKGDVFGGAEQGFVQHDTHVTIDGNSQIGNGYVQMDDDGTYLGTKVSVNRRYTSTEWTDGRLYPTGDLATSVGDNYQHSLPECASWPYAAPYAPYDKYAKHENEGKYYYDSSHTKYAEGGRTTGSDGHTFFGNVFGGGSGFFPYKAGKWHWKAGNVGGNTLVEIKGGHVLTNVYGANEMTNVEGKATVRMTGGTIGVPRTLGQIINHPVTCYLFGGGGGDMRVLFNKQTNVQDAEVSVTGGWVYGSVFGGGEDGHVMRNVDLTIGGTAKIGTWGTSYVDGNIFGGGRGFSADAYTAGNVAGAVKMTISGGTILGSVYGGGRLGSVGYGLYDAGADGYGEMREDHKMDNGDADGGFFDKGRGHVDITISGGTIGNDDEYKYIEPETTIDDSYRSTNHIPYTEFGDDKHLTHTKGGNVFAGGMGRMTQLDGTTAINDVDWWRLGNVKSTKLTITGGTIKSNVYGGCELGMVQGTHTSATSKDVSTEIIISGGTIGTEITKKVDDADVTQYTFGSVFGGGYGSLVEKLDHTGSTNPTYTTATTNTNTTGYYFTYPKYIAGRVKGSTEVTMTGGAVKASVYGGGEMAAVGESYLLKNDPDQTILGETLTGALVEGNATARDGHTYVTVSGGTIGIPKVGDKQFGGGTMGNVYGGGSGYINTVRSGQIYGNTNVNISGTPTIYHNVYGGGAYGTVGDFTYGMTSETVNGVETKKVSNITGLHEQRSGTGTATVTITGGTIGVDGHENGMVFGSSRGEVDVPGKRPDWLAWVNTANVTIGTAGHGYDAPEPQIMGSVYGSGENGHTYQNTVLNIHSGTIGDKTATKETFYKYRGNVYGGGCGEDMYWVDTNNNGVKDSGEEHYNPMAGIVRGNTFVNIDGGLISGSIYGAGAVASVGYVTSSTKHDVTIENEKEVIYGFGLSWPYEFVFAEDATSTKENKVYTGKATINITGGHIGIDGTDGGDVYGSARGEAGDRYTMAQYAYVNRAQLHHQTLVR